MPTEPQNLLTLAQQLVADLPAGRYEVGRTGTDGQALTVQRVVESDDGVQTFLVAERPEEGLPDGADWNPIAALLVGCGNHLGQLVEALADSVSAEGEG